MKPIQNKKKILYVITKSNFGGAQRYVYDMATRLPKKDCTVAVAFGGDGILKTKLEDAKIRSISIPALGRDVRPLSDIRAFFSLLRIIVREKPDILHLNSSKIGIMGGIAGRMARVQKIIFTAHGWAFTEDRAFLSRMIIKLLQWFTIILTHTTIAVSQETADQINDMRLARKKIRVIYNGRSPIRFMAREKARAELLSAQNQKLDKKTLWIGTIAELHRNKGVRYAIRAMAMLAKDKPNTPFVFVIIGEGEERARLEKLIKEEDLTEKVFLVGFQENAPQLMKAFDVFVLPSIKEGLPYTLVEAGMARLPVVASQVGGIPEVIEDMRSGILVQPKKPSELASAFIFLTEKKTQAKDLGKTLSERVKKQFSPQHMLENTLHAYFG